MKKLQLTPAATITQNQHGVLLQSDLGTFQLHGQDISDFVQHVIPLLQGDFDQQQLIEQLTDHEPDSVVAVLTLLKKHQLVEEIDAIPRFSPPWQPHERFFNAWSDPQKRSTSHLAQQRILVVGLQPWAVNMVDELAHAGVGYIHLLDHDVISTDDWLYYRQFPKDSIGQSRATTLAENLSVKTPWSTISYESLTLDEHKQLLVSKKEAWDLVIVTLPHEALFWQNKVAHYIHQGQHTALYGHIDGLDATLGPVVIPEKTPCWNCLRLRKLGASDAPQFAHELDKSTTHTQQTSRARALLAPMVNTMAQQLSMEVLKLLLRYTSSSLVGAINIQNLVTQQHKQHDIIALPWCDVCGGAEHQISVPIQQSVQNAEAKVALSAVSALPNNNPLNQVTTVEQFKNLLAGWIDPVTGIVRQLSGHSPTLPDFPITASAGLSSFTSGEFDPRAMGQVGSGKGLDEVSAHIGAFGEAIERYSAARYHKKNLTYAAISELAGDYVDPTTLVLYSKKQYRAPGFAFSPWKPKQKINWVQGHWLGTDQPVWVPALMSYFNFSCPFPEQFSQVSSNGLAAGQSVDDAAIRATYELIERDAMMLTWYAQLPCQRLTLDAHYQGKMRVMIDDLNAQGVSIELYLLDVGLHVPTVVCLALGDGQITPAVSVSLACHGDIQVATRKALLEQGHVMPYLCSLMQSGQVFPQSRDQVQSLEDHAAYYFSMNKVSVFDFMRQPIEQAIPVAQWAYPVIDDHQALRQRLLDAEVDVAIVDVTAPDVQLSPFRVARAVGVHMQPIHFGEQFLRIDNPRLRQLSRGKAINAHPHPIA